MATWAADWMAGESRRASGPQQALVRQPKTGKYALRPLPNEDIALWVKSIDNSRVPRLQTPQASWQLWRYIGGAVAAVGLVVGLLLPGAYNWLAGYQISQLETGKKQLTERLNLLRLEQAQAESPEQLEKWAVSLKMTAHDAKRLVYLQPKESKKALAEKRSEGAANR